MFAIKIFSESQAFWACSFFGQQLKVKNAIVLYSVQYQGSLQERVAGNSLGLPVYIFDSLFYI